MHYKLKLNAVVAGLFAICGASSAFAADMAMKAPVLPAPASPAFSWAGLYIGGNVGYGWGNSSNPGVSFADPAPPFGIGAYFAAGGNVTPNLNPKGVIGGGQIGYNWTATPNWVLGLVTDFQGSGLQNSAMNTVTPPGLPIPSTQTNSEHIEWFGTVRAKLGFAQNNWLFYGTGGLAYGQVRTSGSTNFTTIGFNFVGANSTTNVGWTAGGGVNYALTPNWIVGVEYLYVDLGRVNYTEMASNFPTASLNISNRAAAQIARATLDYKF